MKLFVVLNVGNERLARKLTSAASFTVHVKVAQDPVAVDANVKLTVVVGTELVLGPVQSHLVLAVVHGELVVETGSVLLAVLIVVAGVVWVSADRPAVLKVPVGSPRDTTTKTCRVTTSVNVQAIREVSQCVLTTTTTTGAISAVALVWTVALANSRNASGAHDLLFEGRKENIHM